MGGNRINWQSKGAVPHGHLRENYSAWIDFFSKCEDLIERKSQLKRSREEVKVLPRAIGDSKKLFKSSLENLKENKNASLRAYAYNHSRHPDPAFDLRFELPDSLLRVVLPSEEEVDRAFEELAETWPKDAISDAERKKRLNGIDRDIQKIDSEIKKYPDFSMWKEFVEDWRRLNSKVSSGCDPQGFPITAKKRSGDLDAFKKLNMASFNNPKSQFQPAAAN